MTTTPMNVTVFGASGKIGRYVVDQLLAGDHHVTAYVRNPVKLTRAGFLGRDQVGSAMTRADIAAFLVDQLADDTYRHAAPAISN